MASDADGDDDFGGLARDLETMSRRRVLELVTKAAAGITLAPIIGACGDNGADVMRDANAVGDSASDQCARIPGETPGPYPGDGTNGPNALTIAGINRSDIRTSIGSASGTATGIELAVTLTVVNAATCEPLVGYFVYLWHCTQAGDYSMYTGAAQSENYLRGVQATDSAGKVTFTTIFPGCYPGRWPHIHVEILSGSMTKVAVSQLALPDATCDAVYATAGYEASATTFAQTSLANDSVFRDGSSRQVVSVTGAVGSNLAGALTIAIAV
ncbi:MAG TPA: hypothetical protein VMZ53_06125 [Kofleriaceae bacterium]|nr:hypothetical protein [Kofleriaceae bacterium]